MVLLFVLSSSILLLSIFYVHGYGMIKTLGLLYQLNSKKNQEKNDELMQMLVYWIVYVLTSFVCCVPLMPTLRVFLMCAMLSPKVNLKKSVNDLLFKGEAPMFEQYMG